MLECLQANRHLERFGLSDASGYPCAKDPPATSNQLDPQQHPAMAAQRLFTGVPELPAECADCGKLQLKLNSIIGLQRCSDATAVLRTAERAETVSFH